MFGGATPTDILSSAELFAVSEKEERPNSVVRRTAVLGAGFRSARMLTYEGEEPVGVVSEVAAGPVVDGVSSTAADSAISDGLSVPIGSLLETVRTPTPVRTPAGSVKMAAKSVRRTPVKSPLKFRTPPYAVNLRLSPGKSSPIKTPTKFVRTPTKLTLSYRSPKTLVRSKRLFSKKDLPQSGTFELGVVPITSSHATPTKPIDEVALVTPPSHSGCRQPEELGKGEEEEEEEGCGFLSAVEDSASRLAFSLSTPSKDAPLDFCHVLQPSHQNST